MKQYIIFLMIILLIIIIFNRFTIEEYTPFCTDKPENECNASPGCRWINNECISHEIYHRPWTFNWNEEYDLNDEDYITNWRFPERLPKDSVAIDYRMKDKPRTFSTIHGSGQLAFGRVTDLNRHIYKQRVAGNRANTGGISSGQLKILSGRTHIGIQR